MALLGVPEHVIDAASKSAALLHLRRFRDEPTKRVEIRYPREFFHRGPEVGTVDWRRKLSSMQLEGEVISKVRQNRSGSEVIYQVRVFGLVQNLLVYLEDEEEQQHGRRI